MAIIDPPQVKTPAQTETPPKPHLGSFAGIMALAVVVDGALLVIFPNLHGNGMILALALATPLLMGISFALWRSGWRKLTPPAVTWGISVALAAVVITDFVLFAGPLFIQGQTAHDSAPQFAGNTSTAPASQATPAPLATPSPASIGPFTFVFDPHTGEGGTTGTAKLGTTSDGKTVLSLINFHTNDGPDLHVFLSRVAHPQNNVDVMNGYEIGALNHVTSGTRNFAVPANVDITKIKSVVIYCVSFSRFFGIATAQG